MNGKYDFESLYASSYLSKTSPFTASIKPAKSTNPFYVITRNSYTSFKQYRNAARFPGFPWKYLLSDAQRFNTLEAAIKEAAVAISTNNTGVAIVKVTEVPGKSERRVVSTMKIDTSKPVVHFNPITGKYSKVVNDQTERVGLQDATVFSDLSDLIVAMTLVGHQAVRLGFGKADVYEQSHAHQVETITTPATFTETVLS